MKLFLPLYYITQIAVRTCSITLDSRRFAVRDGAAGKIATGEKKVGADEERMATGLRRIVLLISAGFYQNANAISGTMDIISTLGHLTTPR